MAKKNYGQYYKKTKNETELEAPEVKMELKPGESTATTEYVPAVGINVEPVAAPTPKPTTGIVTGCSKLNVRAEPETIADILCILDVNSEVMIDMGKSNREWFKVTTASGIDGYCMRKFIKI